MVWGFPDYVSWSSFIATIVENQQVARDRSCDFFETTYRGPVLRDIDGGGLMEPVGKGP